MAARGQTQTLVVTFRTTPGGPVSDVTDPTLTITLDGDVVDGPHDEADLDHDGTGLYRYDWTIPTDAPPGAYLATWTGTLPDADTPSVGYELVNVTEAGVDGVAPFGASVAGVTSLVPEARLWTSSNPIPAGTYAVTIDQVAAWVDELTGVVAMTLDGWQRLNAVAVAPETTSDRDQLVAYARTVVHNGAASYLEAARHPERAGVNDTSYAAVLWARYTDGLTRLTAWLATRLAAGDTADGPDPAADLPAYAFPTPLVGDLLRF